jgi:DNA (cytosine-5)-methyltransferase 1
MIGNAVSVPMAKWIAERLSGPLAEFQTDKSQGGLPAEGSWPSAAWGHKGDRGRANVSEWPVAMPSLHLSSFLEHKVFPLSKKATSGFLSRLEKSSLRYEEAFRLDLAHHAENVEKG